MLRPWLSATTSIAAHAHRLKARRLSGRERPMNVATRMAAAAPTVTQAFVGSAPCLKEDQSHVQRRRPTTSHAMTGKRSSQSRLSMVCRIAAIVSLSCRAAAERSRSSLRKDALERTRSLASASRRSPARRIGGLEQM